MLGSTEVELRFNDDATKIIELDGCYTDIPLSTITVSDAAQSDAQTPRLEAYQAFLEAIRNETAPHIKEKIMTLAQSSTQTLSRDALLPRLAELLSHEHELGPVSQNIKYIFDQTPMSNLAARLFLQEAFSSESGMHFFRQEIIEKANAEFNGMCRANKRIARLLPVVNAFIEMQGVGDDIVEKLIFLGSCKTTHPEQYNALDQEHKEIIDDINAEYFKLNESKQDLLARCVTFLPCEVSYADGSKGIIALVGMSGQTENWNDGSKLCQLHAFLKSFSNQFIGKEEDIEMAFQYVEHASQSFNDILLAVNHDVNPQNEGGIEPNKPYAVCAEKKVFSELAKQLVAKSSRGIVSIKVLGETNIHLPTLREWQHSVASVPSNMLIHGKISDKQKALEKQSVLNETSPTYPEMLSRFDSYEAAFNSIAFPHQEMLVEFISKARENIAWLRNVTENSASGEVISRMRSLLSCLNTIRARLGKEGVVFDFLEVLNGREYSLSAKLHILNKMEIETSSDDTLLGFYVQSAEGQCLPIHFRESCVSCQKLKLPYLSVVTHGTTLPPVSPTKLAITTPPQQKVLKVSPQRCSLRPSMINGDEEKPSTTPKRSLRSVLSLFS